MMGMPSGGRRPESGTSLKNITSGSRTGPLRPGAERCLFFADYMAWCWAWIICCEEGEDHGRVAVIGAGDRRVADSFTDFVKAHIADSMSVC